MNIFVVTENNYLFTGIFHALSERMSCNIVQVNPTDANNFLLYYCANSSDVFIFIPESFRLDFKMLINLNKIRASVIIARSDVEWNVCGIFKFVMIPKRFYLSDLLQSIYINQAKGGVVDLPQMTSREKSILLCTQKCMTIEAISNHLHIARKTAYQHQRNAFKKIGVRKPKDLLQLPEDFLNYICIE